MDKQEEKKEEENDFEDFGKWNDDKREVDETRQKEMRRRMNTHRMTELRMRRTLARRRRKRLGRTSTYTTTSNCHRARLLPRGASRGQQ